MATTRHRQRKSSGAGPWVLVTFLFVCVCLVVGCVVWYLQQPPAQGQSATGAVHLSPLYNYRFGHPASGWESDNKVKMALNANLVIRRNEPLSWLAILAKDYKDRNPRDGEMIYHAVNWIKLHFDGLEWEQRENETVAGKPAQRIVFTGRANNVEMTGEVFLLVHQGFGYWLLTWTPSSEVDAEKTAEEWAGVRKGFDLLKERDGWGEKQARMLTAQGTKAPYALKYAEGVWEKRPGESYDPDADLALFGRDRIESRDATKTATVLMLALSAHPDLPACVTAARGHLAERLKQEYQKDVKLEVVKDKADKAQDGPAKFGKVGGHLVKLRFLIPESNIEKFIVLAVVRQGDATLVLQAECFWERRAVWEPDFMQIVNSLILSGK